MRRRSSRARRALWFASATAALAAVTACNGWSPLDPFQHNAPEVDQAIASMDAGKYSNAERLLVEYLKSGKCGAGGMVTAPDELLQKPNGSFDLGLTLFKLAEKFGRRFGEEEGFAEGPEDKEGRAAEVACAIPLVEAIAHDSKLPIDLRARASYLQGNLKFLMGEYVQAIRFYDEALALVPGLPAEAGVDGIGRDAAHNRALALRRLHEQEMDGGSKEDPDGNMLGPPPENGSGDAGDGGAGEQDASEDGGKGDAGGDAGASDDDDEDNPESAGPDAGDAGKDAGAQGDPTAAGDAGKDAGSPNDDKKEPAGATPPGDQQKAPQQDDRMLDRLEETPSYQQQEARMRANRRRHTMEDK